MLADGASSRRSIVSLLIVAHTMSRVWGMNGVRTVLARSIQAHACTMPPSQQLRGPPTIIIMVVACGPLFPSGAACITLDRSCWLALSASRRCILYPVGLGSVYSVGQTRRLVVYQVQGTRYNQNFLFVDFSTFGVRCIFSASQFVTTEACYVPLGRRMSTEGMPSLYVCTLDVAMRMTRTAGSIWPNEEQIQHPHQKKSNWLPICP